MRFTTDFFAPEINLSMMVISLTVPRATLSQYPVASYQTHPAERRPSGLMIQNACKIIGIHRKRISPLRNGLECRVHYALLLQY